MSEKINDFIELTRIKRPIGYMLLFWPCIWGLTLGYDFKENFETYLLYGVFFLLGSILMRSAGCIVNDIVDKKFDANVERTKNRPIASGKVSVTQGFAYASSLCLLALIVLIQFNKLTIILAMLSMPLAFLYPYMKRFTYWPQLFLGITFNYGILLGWISINSEFNVLIFILYLGAIFWTLGYDTIYGYQDIKDDEIIGVKSTSIKFKNNPKLFISVCYIIFFISLLIVGILMKANNYYYLGILIILYHLLFNQIFKLNISSSEDCLKKFKSNNILGLLILINFIIIKII